MGRLGRTRWRIARRWLDLALVVSLLGVGGPTFAKTLDGGQDAGSPAVHSSSGEDDDNRDRRRRRNRSCNQRLRQLVNYDDRETLAKLQGNAEWQASTQRQIGYLENGLKRRCPGFYEKRMSDLRTVRMWRKTKQAADALVAMGKKVGMAMLTGGTSAWKSVFF